MQWRPRLTPSLLVQPYYFGKFRDVCRINEHLVSGHRLVSHYMKAPLRSWLFLCLLGKSVKSLLLPKLVAKMLSLANPLPGKTKGSGFDSSWCAVMSLFRPKGHGIWLLTLHSCDDGKANDFSCRVNRHFRNLHPYFRCIQPWNSTWNLQKQHAICR